jgi:hypothetical protein
LYKPFRNIPFDIGLSDETVIENWRNFRYRPWHVHRAPVSSENVEDDDDFQEQPTHVEEDFEEWKILSRLVPPNNVNVSDLHTLGRRDFDICFDWEKTTTSNDVAEEAIYFIRNAKSRGVIVENHHPIYVSPSSLEEKQRVAFDIILQHSNQYPSLEPLLMIVQGIAGTGKSFLIHCISHALSTSSADGNSPFLFSLQQE